MFKSILLRPNGSQARPFDMGELIESLLYYQQITLHIGRNEIYELTKTFSPDELRSLLRRPNLSVEYKHSLPTIGTNKGVHFVDTVALNDLDIEKEIYTESKRHTGDRTLSRLFGRRVAPYIEPYTLPQTFSKQLIEQLKDESFRKQAAIQTINFISPGLTSIRMLFVSMLIISMTTISQLTPTSIFRNSIR